MIRVPRVNIRAIDQWPITSSGLPPRIVNCLRRARVKTVGELRGRSDEALQNVRGIGRESIEDIRSFLNTCARIDAGDLHFSSLKDLLLSFLTPVQCEILAMRYGLTNDLPVSGATLQAAGARRGITRERARQLEGGARMILRSCLAQACLKDFHDLFDDFVRQNHGVVLAEDLVRLQPHALLAGFHAEGILVLLSDGGAALSRVHGFFTNLPLTEVERLTGDALEFLEAHAVPLSISRLVDHLSTRLEHSDAETRHRLVRSLLDHSPAVSATEDDRYFRFERGAPHLIREILARHDRPVHFRGITRELNTLLRPGSRKGTGHVLDILNSRPLFSRTTSGYYQLKQSRPDRPVES